MQYTDLLEWRAVLTEAELEQCRSAVERELTPDCASWLEHGGEHRLMTEAVELGA